MWSFLFVLTIAFAYLFDGRVGETLEVSHKIKKGLYLALYQSSSSSSDAIAKILEFLQTLEDQSQARFETDEEVNSEDKKKCKEIRDEIQSTLDGHEDEIEDLEAQVASLGAEVAGLQEMITSLELEKTRADNDLVAATRVHDQAVKDHAAAMEGYFSSIAGVEEAIELVGSGAGASFSQISNLIHKGPLDDDARMLEGAFQPDDSPDSSEVLGTLKDLKATFVKEQGKLSDTEGERRRAFEKQSSDLRDIISTADETQDTKRADLGGKQEELATAEASLRKAKTMSEDAKALLEKTTNDCKERRATFQKKAEVRRQEEKAMKKAIEILSEHVEEHGSEHADTMLLAKADHMQSQRSPGAEAQIVFLRRAAVSLHSKTLTDLSERASRVLQGGTEDPFLEVKAMIQQLIEQMLQKAAEETTQKAYCDEELAKNEHTHTRLDREIRDSKIKVLELGAGMHKLKKEMKVTTSHLKQFREERAFDDEARRNASARNLAEANETQAAAKAVGAARVVLEEFMANNSAPDFATFMGASGLGTALQILKDIQKQNADASAAAKNSESAEARAYHERSMERNSTIIAAESDLNNANTTLSDYNNSRLDTLSELNHSLEQLDDTKQRKEELRPACLEESPSYEERKREREEEIAALREALDILPEESAASKLSLTATKMNRTLAGLKARSTHRNIESVTKMLTEMKRDVAAARKKDKDSYDEKKEWCEKTQEDKERSVRSAGIREGELMSTIEASAGEIGTLNAEIPKLESDAASAAQTLRETDSLRASQRTTFEESERSLLDTVIALREALPAFGEEVPEMTEEELTASAPAVAVKSQQLQPISSRGALLAAQAAVKGSSRLLTADAARASARLLSLAGSSKPSAEVVGILKELLSTYTGNLRSLRITEEDRKDTYTKLTPEMRGTVEETQKLLEAKKEELAEKLTRISGAKSELKASRESLSADSRLLEDLKGQCRNYTKEFKTRDASRKDEGKAIGKALKALEEDQAASVFLSVSRSTNFLKQPVKISANVINKQLSSLLMKKAKQAQRASRLKSKARVRAGHDHGQHRLALESHTSDMTAPSASGALKADALVKVRAKVEGLLATMVQTQKDEFNAYTLCKRELADVGKDLDDKARTKQLAESAEERLAAEVKDLDNSMSRANKTAENVLEDIKLAEPKRAEEHAEFNKTLQSQREHRAALEGALEALREHYGKASFVETQTSRNSTSSNADVSKENSAKAADSVLATLEWLIEDSKNMEAQLKEAEGTSAKAFQDKLNDAQAVIDSISTEIDELRFERSRREAARVDKEKELEVLEDNIAAVKKYEDAVHEKCDELMQNFRTSQSDRREEITQLKTAKATLGKAGPSFLSRKVTALR
eukprot:gnl/MRDRNA2_/MRDRNA2_98403_c0_seq1.p1 gnl/MRDRNA2_/MRDRNA2_98403_c0~~gnl/MRDRNA2_/MRDRNA2_98403_c0_seq1.p1  ORF type:complete len:1374 (-),score=416.23 gnl/MRDRNA2_/MRDRNA2_98403_c0_seq1:2-4123(-)